MTLKSEASGMHVRFFVFHVKGGGASCLNEHTRAAWQTYDTEIIGKSFDAMLPLIFMEVTGNSC